MTHRFTAILVFSLPLLFLKSPVSTGQTGSQQSAVVSSLLSPDLGSQDTTAQSPLMGGVPSGPTTAGELELSLSEAIELGLKNNLGSLLSHQNLRAVEGARRRALSELLPHLTMNSTTMVQQVNLAAFGFSEFPGVPQILGPFGLFDARLFLSQSIIDPRSIRNAQVSAENLKAADYSYRNTRDVIVMVIANIYLQAVAGASRIDAVRAQLHTAETLYQQALDFKKSGLVPGIDVLRAQVEFQTQQQRLISVANDYDKQKLTLARAIGVPVGQQIRLTDPLSYVPLPAPTMEDSLSKAYAMRSDYQSALAKVRAAETARKAATAGHLPSLAFHSDYGVIGPNLGNSHGTFAVAGNLTIPIFQGGRVRADILEADAQLQQRKAELDDLHNRIELELRAVLLDLRAANMQVEVNKIALDLAQQELEQARDRFNAGVVSNLEVVQAQQSQATTNENYISSILAYNVAKAALARVLGDSENSVKQFHLWESR